MKKFLACPSYIDNIVDVRYRKILYKKLLYLAVGHDPTAPSVSASPGDNLRAARIRPVAK
jgi:hypothetical protein